MNLWDLIKRNKVNNEELTPLVRDPYANSAGYRENGYMASGDTMINELPVIKPIQLNADGSQVENPIIQPEVKRKTNWGQRLYEGIMGKQANPTDYLGDVNGDNVKIGISENPRTGGVFRDFANGYNENRNNPLSLDNFGQRKNFATMLGEGVGSLARFADSPLGRGVLAYGLSNMNGDFNPLEQGLTAGVLNVRNRVNDKLYRDALNEQGVDTSMLKGYVTNDAFKNYSLANYRTNSLDVKRQLGLLKDNTQRARLINLMLTNGEISPKEALNRLADYGIELSNLDESNQTKLLPYKQYAYEVAPQVALGNLGVNQGKLGIAQSKENREAQKDALEIEGIKYFSGVGGGGKPQNKGGKVF